MEESPSPTSTTKKQVARKETRLDSENGGNILAKCKTCGREYTAVQTMTYSVYGYCSWDCLMKKKSHHPNHNRSQRRNSRRNDFGNRSKSAQNY